MKMMMAKDKRVRFMNELLNGIKVPVTSRLNFELLATTKVLVFQLWLCLQVVKLYAWEKAFSKVISEYRMGEILMYIRFYLINAFSMHSEDRSERLAFMVNGVS